jgi:hypothetical protein
VRTRAALAAGLSALLLGVGLAAAASLASFLPALHLFGHSRSAPAALARVVIPGTDQVLALQQAAEAAEAATDARNPHNLVFTGDNAVLTSVGTYTDCTGQAELTHIAAAIDTCVGGVRYFIGHNPGVFTGLMHVGVGGLIGYYDGGGRLHRFEVVAVRTWLRKSGVPPPAAAGVVAQFQTCITPDGSVDRILDAVAI